MNRLSTVSVALIALLVACGGGEGEVAEIGTRSSAATGVTTGTVHCSDFGAGLIELQQDIVPPYGTVNVSDGTLGAVLTLTNYRTLSWSSNIGVDYVLVRDSYEMTTFVDYAPAATSGGPIFTASAMPVVSVTLCYDPAAAQPAEPEAPAPEAQPEPEVPAVVVDPGCTLSLGYWKNHSWPSAMSEGSPFFTSSMTYRAVLAAPPKGNPYFQLAHQFIAAQLNVQAGASASSVSAALADATALFEAYTPAAALAGGASARRSFLETAATLAAYNEGEIGPGHCD